jgi:hypothetical protein
LARTRDLFKVTQQILSILRQAIANSRRLGGLNVGEGDGGGCGFGINAVGQRAQQYSQLRKDEVQRLANAQGINIVQRIHGGCTEMDDGAANRALLGKGANFGHEVMANFALDLLCTCDINA